MKLLVDMVRCTNCPWCGSDNLTAVVTRGDGVLIMRCQDCNVCFTERFPRDERNFYDERYFCKRGDTNRDQSNLATHGYYDYEQDTDLDYEFAKYLKILKLISPPRRKLLDVGCATGRFLLKARAHGWDAYGVEVSEYACRIAKEKHGLDVFCGKLHDACFPDNSFDVVTLFDTLEHVSDLRHTLIEARRVLKPSGYLVITTPDFSSVTKMNFSNWVGLRQSLERLFYFEPISLRRIITEIFGGSNLLLASYGPREPEVPDRILAVVQKENGSAPAVDATMRVLFVADADSIFVFGGATVHMLQMKKHIERRGVIVDIDVSRRPIAAGYDLVHIFGSHKPREQSEQAEWVRNYGVPIVLMPIYLDYFEYLTLKRKMRRKRRWRRLLRGMVSRMVRGNSEKERRKDAFPKGYESNQKKFVECADLILPNSAHEMRGLVRNLGVHNKPFRIVPVGISRQQLSAEGDAFIRRYSVRDFILCVGSIELRKNQLSLIRALRGTGLPLVLVGGIVEADYYDTCQAEADSRVVFTGQLDYEVIQSAFRAARVHALPSWCEGAALVNIEAAAHGCAIVVSDRSSEMEYFGGYAYYCDPADIVSIRQAVLAAYENYERDAPRREELKQLILRKYTWEEAAEKTLEAYRLLM